jgi:hydroxyacylglutathione hydrolase
MFFKHIYESDLAQGSYLIGCQKTGEAIVVDPRRDIQIYLDEAERNNLQIIAVTETHIHADYLSGSRELAHATGAALYLSDEGNDDWKYGFEGHRLYDGDVITIGNIRLQAVHTPGHTPEHLSFLVTDGATADAPGFFLTGDFVFVGDLGRPDLLDEAAGGVDTRFEGARQLFASLRDKFLSLPDYVQVWPGHGSGSACGKALGAVASTTVGYERAFAWWVPFVTQGDVDGFSQVLLEGQPDAPLYFGRMKGQNRAGPALLGRRAPLAELDPATIAPKIGQELLLIDTRDADTFRQDGVVGAINIPISKSFATYASYVIDPDTDPRPIVLLAGDVNHAKALRDRLGYVGIDNIKGFVTSVSALRREPVKQVAPEGLGHLKTPYILDVRTKSEFEAGHIPEAKQLHAGRVMWQLDSLPKDRPLVTYCQSGARNAVVASSLRAAGFNNVLELSGSYEGWLAAHRHSATLV